MYAFLYWILILFFKGEFGLNNIPGALNLFQEEIFLKITTEQNQETNTESFRLTNTEPSHPTNTEPTRAFNTRPNRRFNTAPIRRFNTKKQGTFNKPTESTPAFRYQNSIQKIMEEKG